VSGGGTSRDGSGFGGSGPTSEPCDRLTFRARLQSPRPEVVPLLRSGDELDIVLTDDPAVQAISSHGLAGHITTRLPDLLRCINSGFAFVAVVDDVNGGNVEVTVRPAS